MNKKQKLIKKIDKTIGIKKLKGQIRSINATLVFLGFISVYSIYLNHSGWLLSYGLIVAAVSLITLAMFFSYRIKLQMRINNMKLDYRKYIVKPFAEVYFENGEFSSSGSLTEREIVSTFMFSDGNTFSYSSCNELKGVYKNVKFENSDIHEECYSNKIQVNGRLFSFDLPTRNINPVVFTTSTAPIIEYNKSNVHLIKTSNEELNRMFRIYAFDEKEADDILTDSVVHKLKQIVALQLGKIIKICFVSDKVYVFFTTEKRTYEEDLTKKHKTEEELDKIKEKFNVVGKLIDIL